MKSKTTKKTVRQYYRQVEECVKRAITHDNANIFIGAMEDAMNSAPPELRRLTAAIFVHARWRKARSWWPSDTFCAGCYGHSRGWWSMSRCSVRGVTCAYMEYGPLDCVKRARSHTWNDIEREAKAAGVKMR